MRNSARAPDDTVTGRRVWIAQLVAVMGVAAISWTISHRDLPWAFLSGDEAEYAEVARRLATGRGFTTGIIYPIEIEWGVHDQHPSLLRAPLWPVALAAIFTWTGPDEVAVLVAAGICHVITAGLVYALGFALGGRWAGLVAGVAVATSPDVLLYAQLGASETLFGLLTALVFLLLARRTDALWVGLACGLAYLTRYNGGLLLVAAAVLIALRERGTPFRLPMGLLFRLGLGFVVVAGPWWLRNFLVTGDPVYSLYGVTLHFSPRLLPPNGSLIYMIQPDFTSPAAMDPLPKLRVLLPTAIAHWPLWTGNAVACVGWLLGCVRRDRLGLSLFGVVGVTTVLISMMALRGRYLIPFIPVMIALGCAAWVRYGGRLKGPALVLLLIVPFAPTFPSALFDTRLAHEHLDQVRAQVRSGTYPSETMASRFAACLQARPLVIAQNGAAVNWASDTVTLHMTRTDEDFWRLVDDYPVQYVRLTRNHRLIGQPLFQERFDEAPECGDGVYRRAP